MPLTPGARLGPYELVAPLGAGGMGEVYKARDTRLDRVVAIKIVSGLLAGSAELRQRFDREAKTISRLSHPNICAIHDVGHDSGTDYLVLEFVEGETLAARISRGPLELTEALIIAIQIGSALDTAHRHGIIHRDLKPANVMLTKTGAKLLDFGLAKTGAAVSALGAAALSAPPTVTTPITAKGTILGTFQYLAPEQIEGTEADARSDLWSFGCVLYEMLTGRRPFDGKSQGSLMGAILKDQPPPIGAMQPLTSPALEHLVRRCLAKDPDERWQTARDLKRVDVTGGLPQVICDATQPEPAAWSPEGIILFVRDRAQGLASVPATGGQPTDVLIPKPDGAVPSAPSFLPDGRRFLFYARGSIFIASLDGGTPRRLLASESRAEYASPGFILFVRGQTLFAQRFDANRGDISGEAFPLADGIRIGLNGRASFTASQTGALAYRRGLSAAEAQLTWYSAAGKELGTVGQPAAMSDLALSPDGRRLALQRRENDGADIWVLDIARNTASRLTVDPSRETHPVWSADGRSILFSSLRGAGGVFRKAASGVGTEQLVLRASEARPHSLSADGRTVVFDAGGDVWVGTVGQLDSSKPLLANGAYTETQGRLSPDEHYIAYVSTESGQGEIYVASFPDLAERWTVTTGGGTQPIWSQDGKRLYFAAAGAWSSGLAHLMFVEVDRSAGQLRFSQPKAVLSVTLEAGTDTYVVAPDGRILVARALREPSTADPLNIVLNWTARNSAR